MMWALLTYIIFTFIAGMIFTFFWIMNPFDDDFPLIWAPNHMVNSWAENNEINKVGHFIADIIMNLLFAPATLLANILTTLGMLPFYLIIIFAWIFRKRR